MRDIMQNITVYGEIKEQDLISTLSDCPEEYDKVFSEDRSFCAFVKETENQELYTIIIHNDLNKNLVPDAPNAMLSVMGPDSKEVNRIYSKLQEKIGFEISHKSMEVFDAGDELMLLNHEILALAYKAFRSR